MKLNIFSLLLLLPLFAMTGCATVGMVSGGPKTEFTKAYTITSDTPLAVFEKDAAVADKIGFTVSVESPGAKYVLLAKKHDLGADLGGRTAAADVTIMGIGTTTLTVSIHLSGNFGYAVKDNADKIEAQIESVLKPAA